MIDIEQSLRELSEKGQAAVCVPAAFKDVGVDVPQEYFIEAVLKLSMDPDLLARKLGLIREQMEAEIDEICRQYDTLRRQGIFLFIRIGRPTEIGVVGRHLNSVIGVEREKRKTTLTLGGIPPFGREKGNTFPLDSLKRLIPEKDGILLYKNKED
jgi:hypothetical protein